MTPSTPTATPEPTGRSNSVPAPRDRAWQAVSASAGRPSDVDIRDPFQHGYLLGFAAGQDVGRDAATSQFFARAEWLAGHPVGTGPSYLDLVRRRCENHPASCACLDCRRCTTADTTGAVRDCPACAGTGTVPDIPPPQRRRETA